MAGDVIQEFVIALGFDASGVAEGIGQAVSSVGTAANDSTAKVSAATQTAVKGFEGLGKAGQNAAQVLIKSLSGVTPVLTDVVRGLRGFGAALIGAFGSAKLFNTYVEKSDNLGKLSRQLGISAREIDAWSKANEAAGGSAEALQQSLKSFYDATGRPAEEFFKLGEKIEGMSRRQIQLYLRAQGVAWDAIPVFLNGQKEAERLVAKYRKTAFTAQDAQNARRFKVAWSDFKIAAQDVGNVFLRAVLPPVTTVLKALESGVSVVRDNIQAFTILGGVIGSAIGASVIGKIAKGIGGISQSLTVLVASSGTVFPKLLQSLRATGAAVKGFGLALKSALLPLTAIAAGVAAVVLVLDDLMTFGRGGDSLFGDLLSNLGMTADEIQGVRDSIKTVIETLKEAWQAVKPFLSGVITVAVKGFALLLVPILSVLAAIVAAVSKAIERIKGFFGILSDGFDALKRFTASLGDWFSAAFDGAISSVRDFFSSWFDIFIEAVINPIKGAFSGVFGGIKAFFGIGGEDRETPSRQVQDVAEKRAQYSTSNQVTTNATMNVTNNISTRDNPQAIGAAVGASMAPVPARMTSFAEQGARAIYRK